MRALERWVKMITVKLGLEYRLDKGVGSWFMDAK